MGSATLKFAEHPTVANATRIAVKGSIVGAASIPVVGWGVINYVYDASGNKVQKRVLNSATGTTTTTDYLSGYVYENNVLQFFPHEEGRIRPVTNTSGTVYNYDFFVKDHFGNTRMVLTDEQQMDAYPVASLEGATIAGEKNYYTIPDDAATRVNKNTIAGYPSDTYTNPNDYIHKLNGNGTKIGTSILLKVMSGDKVNIRANSWYRLNGANPAYTTSPITDLITALVSQTITGPSGKLSTPPFNSGITQPVNDFISNRNTTNYDVTRPKAYLNYVLLDDQMKPVLTNDGKNSGFDQVGGDQVFTTHQITNREITKNGYLYVYVSNESQLDVFFDNLQISQLRGPLMEETHYYPFGLTMAGISSKAAGKLENKFKYNGIEHNSDWDVNTDDAFFRTLDPAIGRWWQVDPKIEMGQESWTPYNSMMNNPIRYQDPKGDCVPCLVLEGIGEAVSIGYRAYRAAKGIEAISNAVSQANAPKTVMTEMIITTDAMGNTVAVPSSRLVSYSIGQEKIQNTMASEKVSELKGEIKSLENGIKSNEKQIKTHREKLNEYKSDPEKGDNKGKLEGKTPEQQQKVIDGRINRLEKTIEKHQREIQKKEAQINEKKAEISKIQTKEN